MDDGSVVRLRATRRVWRNLVPMLAVFPVGLSVITGIIVVATHDGTFVQGLFVGLAPSVVIDLLVLYERLPRRYAVHGTTLVYGLTRRRLSLYQVAVIVAERWRRRSNARPEVLLLHLDQVRIRLGDNWCRDYYAPDGLHALADGLALSPHPSVQDGARWLHYFADNGGVEAWPTR